MESTDNSRIYRIARRYLYTSCSFCRPHRGDNASHKFERNWKRFRKHQQKGRGFYGKTQYAHEDRNRRYNGSRQVDSRKNNVILSLGSLIDWYRDWYVSVRE